MNENPFLDSSSTEKDTSYCGFVVLAGKPNAGKSTLLNYLVGQKISIVSPKAHTTRFGIYGMVCKDQHQIIFVDTPGTLDTHRGEAQKEMAKHLARSCQDGDATLLIMDAKYPMSVGEIEDFTKKMKKNPKFSPENFMIVLNKIDTLSKEKLLPLTAMLEPFTPHVAMISAKKGKGIDYIVDFAKEKIPHSPWLFEDEVTQLPQRVWAAEITREKVFHVVHQEVPYALHVTTQRWYETSKNLYLEQIIYVSQARYRKWILGYQGKRISLIGRMARQELSQHLEKTVHLFLDVQVHAEWWKLLQDPMSSYKAPF